MPYNGVDEKDTQWMENCVMKVMKQGKDKSSAIAICKTSLDKSSGDESKAEILVDLVIDKRDIE